MDGFVANTGDAWTTPLDAIDVSDPARFQDDTVWDWFARLRRDAPVHYCRESRFGPYWSVTRFRDIMAIEAKPEVFSSESSLGGITIRDRPTNLRMPSFIAMDPPKHGPQRATVQPIAAPMNLARLEAVIRQRVRDILDALPMGEPFDWVDRVSIELTTSMLATLFDFPFEDRRLLTWWSDVATADFAAGGPIDTEEKREAELAGCLAYFQRLWAERAEDGRGGFDLITMMTRSEATRNMPEREFLGNLILLIVGGNDTTRNSISGGLLFLHRNPGEWAKLRANPGLIPGMVSEIVRYQTPLSHMRRTALRDFEFKGHRIRAGDKVVVWYISGNRDPDAITEPERFIIDRAMPRRHLSFGFGIHRCVGERLAEMQLRILWEEILPRFPVIEVLAEPTRVYSAFVHGIASLPVRIPARTT